MANTALLPITVNSRQGLFSTPLKLMSPAANGCLGEGSTQSWKIGAPLVFSSGFLVEASATPTAVVGFATAAATGVTGAPVIYIPAYTPTLEFEASIDKASGQAGASAKLAGANVGTLYGLVKDSGGIWYVDVDSTAQTYFNFRLMGFKENPALNQTDSGVINGRGIFIAVITSNTTPDGTIYF